MLDPRSRSLNIARGMSELERLRGRLFDFEAVGSQLPERLVFTFRLKSVMSLERGRAIYSPLGHVHEVELWLRPHFPETLSNQDVRFLSPRIFHPNVFWMTGNVCVGGFVPSESLGRFALRLARMIKFEPAYINDRSAANADAAAWYRANLKNFPIDPTMLPSLDRFDAGEIRKEFIPGRIRK